MKLIVMIPAYNEAKLIGHVIKNIPRKIEGIKKVETLVMDDNSTDNTSFIAKKSGADYVITNHTNLGLGRNFRNGIKNCLKYKADIIVNIDGDQQFDPSEIPRLIKPILEDKADMVTGSRFLNPKFRKRVPFIKRWGNKRFTSLISKITKKKFTDTQCGFRAYSKEAALRLNLFGEFTYTQEVFIDLAEKNLRIKEIPINVKYFSKRNSYLTRNLTRYGFRSLGIIARAFRDTQPLTFFGLPGLVIFSLGFLGGLASFLYWLIFLMTTPVRTLFNVSVFFMTIGVALMVLGLIADMLRRINITQEEILYKLKKQELK